MVPAPQGSAWQPTGLCRNRELIPPHHNPAAGMCPMWHCQVPKGHQALPLRGERPWPDIFHPQCLTLTEISQSMKVPGRSQGWNLAFRQHQTRAEVSSFRLCLCSAKPQTCPAREELHSQQMHPGMPHTHTHVHGSSQVPREAQGQTRVITEAEPRPQCWKSSHQRHYCQLTRNITASQQLTSNSPSTACQHTGNSAGS